LPYQTGVLENAPTGPDIVIMPGNRRSGREATPFPSPAGNLVKGDPVGTAGEVLGDRGDHGGQRDDADAAEALFKGVYPKLAGWVRRLVDDDDTAHEIASEAFVRLLGRWTKVESPQSYLYMIATNLVRDHWRKTERERRAIRSVTAGGALDPVAYPTQDVDVRNLIASLPPRLRDPFLLHYYGGFGIREVATLLHRPEGTIKADLFAARAKLKTALGERDG
jgi:RNA polymerase sigma-70 factor, ECF subfamily